MQNYIYDHGLESERLQTRMLTVEDNKAWIHFLEDKESVAFLPDFGSKSPQERADHWIKRQLNRYANKEFGLQALIDKKTNSFIGQCGLLKQTVDGKIETEVGYHIFRKNWGQGYAPEERKKHFQELKKSNFY